MRGAAPTVVGLLVALTLVGTAAFAAVSLRPTGVLEQAPLPVLAQPPHEAARPTTGIAADPGARPEVDEAWVAASAERAGIPAPAVRAYGRAVLSMATDDPACRIGWTTLAGIGWVESRHGTIGERSLEVDGRPSEPILGPVLDGSPGIAAIPATPESAQWHGNAAWDHALGPMQFIPSTWRRWSSDGDGDGVADPHDLDDAAYAAARYLCADGHALETGPGWRAAIFGYNHSDDYVRAVHHAAMTYATRVG